jgi:hypothetical protein
VNIALQAWLFRDGKPIAFIVQTVVQCQCRPQTASGPEKEVGTFPAKVPTSFGKMPVGD